MGEYRFNWVDEGEEFLINPRLLGAAGSAAGLLDLDQVRRSLPRLPGHIWFFTSGTSGIGVFKWVALSKKALLCSSAAVNSHLHATATDTWLCLLPHFHVGGAQIYSRAFLSNSRVISSAWQTDLFPSLVNKNSVTLVSLVPQQLFDLVTRKIPSPPTLRAVIIGGGSLASKVYEQAKELGYPVMPSYGLTECASQVATANLAIPGLSAPELRLLPHIEAKTTETHEASEASGRLWIKSEALLTGYALIQKDPSSSTLKTKFIDPKVDGWFKTEDLASISEETSPAGTTKSSSAKILKILGRLGDTVKISGFLVNIANLRNQLHLIGLSPSSATIVSIPDERRENSVIMVLEKRVKTPNILEKIEAFCASLPSHERPRDVFWVDELPKTELGKVKLGEVSKLIKEMFLT